ncbi:MAG: endonuclease/exonuclease/phosphatase family protein [Flavobacteriaceae bacterium]
MKRKSKLSLFNKLVYFVNFIAVILLLLGFALPLISPKTAPRLSVLSLSIPILFIINIAFVLYWILGIKRQFLLSLVSLIIGLFLSSPLYNIGETNKGTTSDLKVMSYNVRLFNVYDWIDDTDIPIKILNFITKENPDIISFQEFHPSAEKLFNYPFKYVKISTSKSKIGQAIYSKYKIINEGSVNFNHTINDAIYVDVVKNLDTIRIYNLHLESLGLQVNKENFGQKNPDKLIKRLGKEFAKQQNQVEKILKHKQLTTFPVILTGDFNNTAYSWLYKNLKGAMNDSFLESGSGFGKTFDLKGFPMRIDYIFTDKLFTINKFENYTIKYSDHLPIMATIGLY